MPHPPRLLTHDGRTQKIEQWSEETGIPVETIRCRIDKLKWDVGKALTTRPDRRFRKGGRLRTGTPRPVPRVREDAKGVAFCRWRPAAITTVRSARGARPRR